MELSDSLCSLARPGSHFSVRSSTSGKPLAYGPSAPHPTLAAAGVPLRSTKRRERWREKKNC
jgi:hypothetical protein